MNILRAAIVAAIVAGAGMSGGSEGASAVSVAPTQYGLAPEFAGIDAWLNSGPLRMADLRGKVVLVKFWTYACGNCLRALPQVVQWHEKYKDQGLVVVGVHTPEFPHERLGKNVQAAIDRLHISFPVAQDNEYATWKAYRNQFWPTSYLIDQHGRMVLKHVGEGDYEETEAAIRALLANDPRRAHAAGAL